MRNVDDNNIGSIFKGLDRFINIVGDMIDNDKNEVDIKGTINNPDKSKKIVGKYGFNIKLGTDEISGLKDIKTLNTIRNKFNIEKEGPKTIEPVTDIFDEEDKVIVVMELTGVKQQDINLQIDENILKLRADGNGNCYSKNIKLRFTPKLENINSKLNNAIYSITINKKS